MPQRRSAGGEKQRLALLVGNSKIVDSQTASIPSSTELGMIVRVRRLPYIIDRLRIVGWAQCLGEKVRYARHGGGVL
jgi:hypothetical protein